MSFNLEIEFSGLCLYVVHPEQQRVAVLLPDARRTEGNDPPRQVDGEEGVPHVGYLRFNLANLITGLPAGVEEQDFREGPEYEVIHRFDRQVLELTGLGQEPMTVSLDVPNFARFASDMQLAQGLFSANPPPTLLMRTILVGGTLAGGKHTEKWHMAPLSAKLEASSPPAHVDAVSPQESPPENHAGSPPPDPLADDQFASGAMWTRKVEADEVGVRISTFEGGVHAAFTLRPVAGAGSVRLKIANLCAENPLEWAEMNLRKVEGDDIDFKWLYSLIEVPKVITAVTGLADLPVPRRGPGGLVGHLDDCMPARITASF
jgi:hypothetical protein